MAENIDPDLLISLVEDRPVLWDKTIDNYKDKNLKTSAWKEVCRGIFPTLDEKTNKEKTKLGNEVLKKWKNMKDNFAKYDKKLESLCKSGAGAKKLKEYHFYKQLPFLKKNAANITDSSIIEEEESDAEFETNETARSRYQPAVTSRKRKSNDDEFESQIIKALKQSENRHLSFFKAILPSVNKLDDHKTLLFQGRVLNVLTDLVKPPHQNEQNSYSYEYYPSTHANNSYQRAQSSHQTPLPYHRPLHSYETNNQKSQPSCSYQNKYPSNIQSSNVSHIPDPSFQPTNDNDIPSDTTNQTNESDFDFT